MSILGNRVVIGPTGKNPPSEDLLLVQWRSRVIARWSIYRGAFTRRQAEGPTELMSRSLVLPLPGLKSIAISVTGPVSKSLWLIARVARSRTLEAKDGQEDQAQTTE